MLITVNILLFAFNIFKTVLSKNDTRQYTFFQFLCSAFGIPRLLRLFGREDKGAPNLDYNGLPVFLVAVGRGSIDTVINAIVLLSAGALILVYGLFAPFGSPLNPGAVDALVYKNWYWWGLDMMGPDPTCHRGLSPAQRWYSHGRQDREKGAITMTVHPFVTQLRFARSEFQRCLDGISAEDAVRRLEPMNCICGFHTGEAHAIRQMLGHGDLPQFVGDMTAAVHRPERESAG